MSGKETVLKLSYIVWMMLLAVISWQDLKKKEISGKLLILRALLGSVIQLFERSISLGSWAGGIFLGLSLLFLGFVSRESIGYGDGWLVLVMGMSLGFLSSFLSFLLGLGISALVSGWLLMFKKVKRKYRIPFAPFLFLGCLICITL